MPEKKPYEYAVIRLAPRVEREEFLNVGVVLYAASRRFLQMKFLLDKRRLRVFATAAEIKEACKYLEAFERICVGAPDSGPIGTLPMPERFRWLTATRSTVIQVSKVHCGLCTDPQAELEDLFQQFVAPVERV
jgi:Protein of unknown function (DUF3037)